MSAPANPLAPSQGVPCHVGFATLIASAFTSFMVPTLMAAGTALFAPGQIAGEAVGKIHEPKPPAGGIAFPAAPVRRKARQAHAFLEARGGAQMRFAGGGPLVEGGATPLLKQQQTGSGANFESPKKCFPFSISRWCCFRLAQNSS